MWMDFESDYDPDRLRLALTLVPRFSICRPSGSFTRSKNWLKVSPKVMPHIKVVSSGQFFLVKISGFRGTWSYLIIRPFTYATERGSIHFARTAIIYCKYVTVWSLGDSIPSWAMFESCPISNSFAQGINNHQPGNKTRGCPWIRGGQPSLSRNHLRVLEMVKDPLRGDHWWFMPPEWWLINTNNLHIYITSGKLGTL